MTDFFERFDTVRTDVVHARVGGSGPAVLMLHGYPQTHVMWHRIAPVLAATHTVVLADLRGDGAATRPEGGYDKRTMAADQVELMWQLGFHRFAVVGHDRGARVAHRLCLDHPQRVTRAALLDIVPTRYALSHTDRELAIAYYHWFFLAQPPGLPERLIGADPDFWVRYHLRSWSRVENAFDPAAEAAYVAAFQDPEVIRAPTTTSKRCGGNTRPTSAPSPSTAATSSPMSARRRRSTRSPLS